MVKLDASRVIIVKSFVFLQCNATLVYQYLECDRFLLSSSFSQINDQSTCEPVVRL